MPSLTGPIDHWGPMAEVKVMLSVQRVEALKRMGLPFSPPEIVKGLIDSGASCSAIDVLLVGKLGLEPRGLTHVHTPSTGDDYQAVNIYDACFVLGEGQSPALHLTLSVIESSLANQGFSVLVGRDVLEHCVFTYDGPTAKYVLRWAQAQPTLT